MGRDATAERGDEHSSSAATCRRRRRAQRPLMQPAESSQRHLARNPSWKTSHCPCNCDDGGSHMRKLFVALLLVLGAAILAMPALAELTAGGDIPGKLFSPSMAMEMKSRAARLGTSSVGNDTTYIGYNPAYAGSNYW